MKTNKQQCKILDERYEHFQVNYVNRSRSLIGSNNRYNRILFVTVLKHGFSIRRFFLLRNIKKAGGWFKYSMMHMEIK